jgi:hypothetical protein
MVSISDISEVYTSSIFRVEMRKECQYLYMYTDHGTRMEVGLVIGTDGDNGQGNVIKTDLLMAT